MSIKKQELVDTGNTSLGLLHLHQKTRQPQVFTSVGKALFSFSSGASEAKPTSVTGAPESIERTITPFNRLMTKAQRERLEWLSSGEGWR